ncbi:ABC transporter permease [Solitalea sp. MAHUQ-68]|uniref:ABC transporter permease n=1 Tax=Solitalea agri TaxID=2953739 RepID=A0A9X2F6Y4_9SPHI|nr:ABC transporter permease [Solitalea agri]MCO4291838.1 ABC transporter permease [Solitalea agri]
MLTNYIKIAWRNLIKNKTFSLINIIGLATGLACFILISLYVFDELSYDKYNVNADRIFRINSDLKLGSNEMKLAVTSDPMGETLKKDYPQVEEFVRIYNSNGAKLIKKGNEFIEEQNVAHADSTLFDVFTLPVIEGNAKKALTEPNSVVITASTARKYFGTTAALGKVIEANKTPYKVTAVIKDIPHNSHFNFDFIFSMQNVDYNFGTFLSHNFHTYLLLKKGTNYKAFEKNFAQVIQKYIFPQAKQFMQINSMDDFYKAGNKLEYNLIPLTDIHLKSDRGVELAPNGSIQYVYIFSAVALFILLLACINFMNLSTARSSRRAKEVGIRKVLGTERRSLIGQFLTESTLTVIISTVIAVVMVWLVLPSFNELAAKSLSIKNLLGGKMLLFLIILPFVVGAISGSYPAFFLSKFQPIVVLKGKLSNGMKNSWLRGGLVVFQFVTSIVLIIGTIIVYRQLNYIQTKKLGFDKEQVLIIDRAGALQKNVDAFKNEVGNMPGVLSGTVSGFLPVSSSWRNDNTFSKETVMNVQNSYSSQVWGVDYEYLKTLGMQLSAGRNFSKDFGADSSAIIINESTAQILGYKDPIGQKVYTLQDTQTGVMIPYTIIGVVKNFHFESLRQNIGPLALILSKTDGYAAFKVKTKDMQALIQQVETKWKSLAPGMPFSYRFLDDSFDDMYRTEQRVGKIAIVFAMLAIVIACLGLFGLVAYSAEQRTKEIGIRKVLGASAANIITMLSKDFLKLVFVASLIAFPIAWYAMNKWLQDFVYRIEIGWWVFVLAGLTALVIALVTLSFQSVKAALANPVKSLRTE